MTEIPARDHEFGLEPLDQHRRAPDDRVVVAGAEVQVREVENTRPGHRGSLNPG